jgi:hypothetical protein
VIIINIAEKEFELPNTAVIELFISKNIEFEEMLEKHKARMPNHNISIQSTDCGGARTPKGEKRSIV